jgi:hypothetical protein
LGAVDGDGSLADKLVAACVVEPELEQMRWATLELQKCLGVLQVHR